jgi:hypothetical protein
MNDDFKIKQVEKIGSDYRVTVGPSRDPHDWLSWSLIAVVTLMLFTMHFLGLMGIGSSLLLALAVLLFWAVIYAVLPTLTTVLAAVSLAIYLLSIFLRS